ncbi:hypothetical protein ACFELO_03580 [Oceanicaulis sp. LC35]|uniref:hypothetical protein n=1 Tax=Oceanicaulis sp. LC35 TaxID=3349635 RepID=UPI003F879302
MKLIRTTTLTLAVLALPLSACGKSDEERARDEAVDALAQALGSREAAEQIARVGEEVAAEEAGSAEAFQQTFDAMMREAGMRAAANTQGFDAHPANMRAGAGVREGETRLRAGFSPDPHMLTVHAGGRLEIASQDGLQACRGYTEAEPNHALTYMSDGQAQLVIDFASSGDASLTVRAPNGQWYCNDDYGSSLNPRLVFAAPPTGRYDIWVGNLSAVESLEGQLSFSAQGDDSLDAAANRPYEMAQNFLAQAIASQTGALPAGVEPGTGIQMETVPVDTSAAASGGRHDFRGEARGLSLPVEFGGALDLSVPSSFRCLGGFASAPSAELRYRGNGGDLFISGQALNDTTLAVRAPDGRWYCNDDAWSLNPGLRFVNSEQGLYQIWMGSYGAQQTGEAQIHVSSTGFGPQN